MKANDFDSHWNDYSSQDLPITKKIEAQRFLRPLFATMESRGPLRVLDAGCGDGVHIEVIAANRNAVESGCLVGLDISMSALHAARRRGKGKWEFVQGDLGKLPFVDSGFDVVFSFGVLAYTDDPPLSFSEFCRVTKMGGYIGIWVYPRIGGLGGVLFSLARRLCQLTAPLGSRIIAECIVPFLGFLPTRSKMNLANASWKQCREVVLVNLRPRQLVFPTPSEVEGWFKRHNIKITDRDRGNPVTVWGVKC